MPSRDSNIGRSQDKGKITAAISSSGTVGDYEVEEVSGNITRTLPLASTILGAFYTFKKTDSNATTVTIDASGSDTIDGQVSIQLTEQYENVTVIGKPDGTGWGVF